MVKKMKYEEWKKQVVDLFGNIDNAKFKCSRCGHIQSINSVLKHNPNLTREEVITWIYCNCEGRINKKYGCDWSLYGFLQTDNIILIDRDENQIKAFEFADNNGVEKKNG
jgi:hypothetical protein